MRRALQFVVVLKLILLIGTERELLCDAMQVFMIGYEMMLIDSVLVGVHEWRNMQWRGHVQLHYELDWIDMRDTWYVSEMLMLSL